MIQITDKKGLHVLLQTLFALVLQFSFTVATTVTEWFQCRFSNSNPDISRYIRMVHTHRLQAKLNA